MKKWMIVLILALTLAGCGQEPDQPTTLPPETTAPTEATEPTEAFYVPDSAMERGTGGAVRQYQTDVSVTGIGRIGDNLVLCDDSGMLSLLSGQPMEIQRQRQLEQGLSWSQASLTLSDSGIAYYDSTENAYVILDSNLVTAAVVSFPEALATEPVISSDFTTIYYVSGGSIRAMDVSNGITRLLREESGDLLRLEGLAFDGSVLCYTRQGQEGDYQNCFINTADGSLFDTAQFQGQIEGQGQLLAGVMKLEHPMGTCKWVVVSDLEGELQMLQPRVQWENQLFPGDDWVMLQHDSQVGLTLYCYDLTTGALISQVLLPEIHNPFAYGCVMDGKIWLCDGISGRFYCWDPQQSGKGDDSGCLTDFASLTQPDTAGMDACTLRAQRLSQQYNVRITFAGDTNRIEGVDYDVYPDYRPDLYGKALDALERALKQLPKVFLQRVGQYSDAGKLEIRLVDDYDPTQGIPEGTGSVDLENGAQAALVSMCPELEEIFFHELFHIVDTQISKRSDGLKDWASLNPEDFEYSGSESAYEAGELASSQFLVGENRAFADDRSLVSPREDRAQIFLYAMDPDQGQRFETDAMQRKLSRLCTLIRSQYRLEEDTVLPWEQHLAVE